MKKLLLLSNFILVVFCILSCQNMRSSKSETSAEAKPVINGTAVTNDTLKSANQTEATGAVGETNGVIKDTVKPVSTGNAIIHPLPNQEKIDSIKNAKKKIVNPQ